MSATNLIVEYLVAGTLIIVAILAATASWSPDGVESLSPLLEQASSLESKVVLPTVFVALAYALGMISEYVGESCFEWLLNKTKRERMSDYLKKHRALLRHSPILGSFARQPEEKRDVNAMAASIGKMRFFVMHHSALLYADIAAQVSRYRLMRVLFVVEVIMTIAVIGQLYNTPSIFWWLTLGLIIAIAIANFMAVRSRLGRYCRAVERAYLVLLQDQVMQYN